MQIVVVGGGTATNAIASVFSEASYRVVYIVPISDNGGSTSEILRVFGGPGIGDARSRLVTLMDHTSLRNLLALRLSDNEQVAAQDWSRIVDGSHPVWSDIAPHMKAMYRAFLVHVHAELLKRMSVTLPFNFRSASIGNLLLTGARLYFGTLEAALEFVLHTTRVSEQFGVLPCLDSSFAYHIAAKLVNNSVVVGQSAISHPSGVELEAGGNEIEGSGENQDGNLPFSHPNLRARQITFAKDATPSLAAAIDRVYYVNMYGDEIKPRASPRVLTSLHTSDAVVFSIGSLYTSIIPVLLLQGIAACLPRIRVLIINGSEDRETHGMTALDYVRAINNALRYSLGQEPYLDSTPVLKSRLSSAVSAEQFITAVIHPSEMDISDLRDIGIQLVPAECYNGAYNLDSLSQAVRKCLLEGPSFVKLTDIV